MALSNDVALLVDLLPGVEPHVKYSNNHFLGLTAKLLGRHFWWPLIKTETRRSRQYSTIMHFAKYEIFIS